MQIGRMLVLVVTVALLVNPAPTIAQQTGKVWRIGVLQTGQSTNHGRLDSFKRGMVELGYREGLNVIYEARFADDKYEALPALAAELVRLNVDVILASPTPSIRAAQGATRTIPIVMATGVDPVGTGLVQSLAHPGGNITGLSNLGGEFTPKLLELLKLTIPGLTRVAVLGNPGGPATKLMLDRLRSSASALNIALYVEEANTQDAVDKALQKAKHNRAQAILVLPDAFFVNHSRWIAESAAKVRMPVSGFSGTAESGGLMSYGPNIDDQYRHAATFVDKILRGAKPAELPVEQATQLEFVLNLKTAKSIGMKIPQAILVRANRLIE